MSAQHLELQRLELPIEGMTCAACAVRIEKKLNKLAGVEATVNYTTERATVAFAPAVAPSDLVAAVEAAGYRALLPGDEARRTRRAQGVASPSPRP